MSFQSLPVSVHRRILSFLPWQSHIPVSEACIFWNKLLAEDEFRSMRYSKLQPCGVVMHKILSDPCIGFKVRFSRCGMGKAMVGMDFFTTGFSKQRAKSACYWAMAQTFLGESGCILSDPLFPASERNTTKEGPKRSIFKRVRKPVFLHENNNVKTRYPMSIRIGIVDGDGEPAVELLNIDLSKDSMIRDSTVGSLLRGVADSVAGSGMRKELEYLCFEVELWRWLPQHYFGTIRATKDPLLRYLPMEEPMPVGHGKRARLASKLKEALEKLSKLVSRKTKGGAEAQK
ncbi:hypothetical protein TWF730_003707 [Orbilia blumenaviensis]|uniref:F-box domain-containing protein n=1 Tax=Orbilia blumenaviensis TaxID=1796055 RepID=A0AAV9U350_9PEZI